MLLSDASAKKYNLLWLAFQKREVELCPCTVMRCPLLVTMSTPLWEIHLHDTLCVERRLGG